MNDQENLHQEFEKHQEFIRSLPLEDLLDRLVKAHDSTDVILEGYNLVTTVNEGHGIALAGIIRLREALAEILDWVEFNLTEDTENEEL